MTLIEIPIGDSIWTQNTHVFLVRLSNNASGYAFGVENEDDEKVAICFYNVVSQQIDKIELWNKDDSNVFCKYVHTIDKGNGEEPKAAADQETAKLKILDYLKTRNLINEKE